MNWHSTAAARALLYDTHTHDWTIPDRVSCLEREVVNAVFIHADKQLDRGAL